MNRTGRIGLIAVCMMFLIHGCGGVGSSLRWEINPPSRAVSQGSSASYTITVFSVSSITSTVAFRVTDAPTGSVVNLNPAVLTANGTPSILTIQTSAGTPKGNYRPKIFASDAGRPEERIDISLDVQ